MASDSTVPLLGGAECCSDCVAVCAATQDPDESSGCCNDEPAAGGEEFLVVPGGKEMRGASCLPDEAGGRYVLPVLPGDKDGWGADAALGEQVAGLVALLLTLGICADRSDWLNPLLLDEVLDDRMEP